MKEAHMRSIAEIKEEIKLQTTALAALKAELKFAQFATFIKDSGVPDGVRPIFAHKRTGERVLASSFSDYWPKGFVFKKDGTLSDKVERTIYTDEYTFVGEPADKP